MGLKLRVLAVVGGVLGFAYLYPLGCNHFMHNEERLSDSMSVVSRPDGPFSHTRLTRFHDPDIEKDEVYQFKLFSQSKYIIDGGTYGKHDGLVDRIHFVGLSHSKVLDREKDYEKFKEEFDNADKILAETKERFAEYFK